MGDTQLPENGLCEDRELKILLLSFPLSEHGGTLRQLSIWLEALPGEVEVQLLFYNRPGHDVGKMLSQFTGRSRSLGKLKALRVAGRLSPVASALNTVAVAVQVYRRLRSGDPHILLSTFLGADIAAWLAITLLGALARRSVKHVVYIAGSPVPPAHADTFRWSLYTKVARVIYPQADRIIVISQRLRELLVTEYGVAPEKVEIVPISIRFPAPGYLPAPGRSRGEFVFGVVSRLDKDKSVDHVIRALARLLAEGREVRLKVFGTGERLASLQELSRELGLRDAVVFCGWVGDSAEAFAEIDCLVLASQYEGTPRSILEAGYWGIPSIASSVGGVPNVISHGNTGWLYTYGDLDELAGLMRIVAESPDECARVGEAFRREVLEVRKVSTEISSLLRSLRSVIQTGSC